MITPFALLLGRCGLSHREAADLLGVRTDTVKSWSAGRNQTPDSVIAELRQLYARIERAANEQLILMDELAAEHGSPDAINLTLAANDAAARERGWPCVGAQAAAYGIVIAHSPQRRFRIS